MEENVKYVQSLERENEESKKTIFKAQEQIQKGEIDFLFIDSLSKV